MKLANSKIENHKITSQSVIEKDRAFMLHTLTTPTFFSNEKTVIVAQILSYVQVIAFLFACFAKYSTPSRKFQDLMDMLTTITEDYSFYWLSNSQATGVKVFLYFVFAYIIIQIFLLCFASFYYLKAMTFPKYLSICFGVLSFCHQWLVFFPLNIFLLDYLNVDLSLSLERSSEHTIRTIMSIISAILNILLPIAYIFIMNDILPRQSPIARSTSSCEVIYFLLRAFLGIILGLINNNENKLWIFLAITLFCSLTLTQICYNSMPFYHLGLLRTTFVMIGLLMSTSLVMLITFIIIKSSDIENDLIIPILALSLPLFGRIYYQQFRSKFMEILEASKSLQKSPVDVLIRIMLYEEIFKKGIPKCEYETNFKLKEVKLLGILKKFQSILAEIQIDQNENETEKIYDLEDYKKCNFSKIRRSLTKYILESSIKQFPRSTLLRLFTASKLLESEESEAINNTHFILDEMDDKNLQFQEKKALADLRIEMKERLQVIQSGNALNNHFAKVLKNEEKMDNLKALILKKIGISIQFWNNFKSNTPGLKLLFNQANELEKQKQILNKTWQAYKSEFSNYYFIHNLYYGLYKLLNDQDYEAGEKLINKYFAAKLQEQSDSAQKSLGLTEKGFFQSDNIIVRVSGHKGADLGKVIYCSGPLYTKLGIENENLIGKNIGSIMTPYLASCHHDYLVNFQKTGKAKMINKENTYWLLNKEGYISRFHTFVQLSLDINQGMTFLGIIKEIQVVEDAIVLLSNGTIDGITKNISKRLRLNPNKKYKIGDLCLDFQLSRSTSHHEKESSTIKTPQKINFADASSGFAKEEYFPAIQERLSGLWDGGMELKFKSSSNFERSYSYVGTISEKYLSIGVLRVLHLKTVAENNLSDKNDEDETNSEIDLEEEIEKERHFEEDDIHKFGFLGEVEVPEEKNSSSKYFEVPLSSPSFRNFPKFTLNTIQNTHAGFLEPPLSPGSPFRFTHDNDIQYTESTRPIIAFGHRQDSLRDGNFSPLSRNNEKIEPPSQVSKDLTQNGENHSFEKHENQRGTKEKDNISFLMNDDTKRQSEMKTFRGLDQDRSSNHQSRSLSTSKLLKNFDTAITETNTHKIFRIIVLLFATYSMVSIILVFVRHFQHKTTIEMIRANTNIINVFVKRTEIVLENIRDLISIDLCVSDVVHDNFMAGWGYPSYSKLIGNDFKKHNIQGIIDYNNQMRILVGELKTKFQLEFSKQNVKWYFLDANPTEDPFIYMNTFEAANQMAHGTTKVYNSLMSNNNNTLLSDVRLILQGGLNDFLVSNNKIPATLQSELENTVDRMIKFDAIALALSLTFACILISLQIQYIVVQNKFKQDLVEKLFRIQPVQIETLNKRLILYEDVLKKDYRNKNVILLMRQNFRDTFADKKDFAKNKDERPKKDQRILNYKGLNTVTNWIALSLFLIQSLYALYYLTDLLNDKTLEKRETNLIGKQIGTSNKFSEASQVYTLFLSLLTTNPDLTALNESREELFIKDLYNIGRIDEFLNYFRTSDGGLENQYSQLLTGYICPYSTMEFEECDGLKSGVQNFGIMGLLTVTSQTISNMYNRFQTNRVDLQFRHDIFASTESNNYWKLFEYVLVSSFDHLNDMVKAEIIEYEKDVLETSERKIIFKILGWVLITIVWFLLAYNLVLRKKMIFNVLKMIPLKLIIENKALKYWLMKSSPKIQEALKMT